MALADTLLQDVSVILTLVVLEAVLSFDNAAILAALSRKLPDGGGRKRALNYGLGIAYVLRVIAIFSVWVLINFPVFLTVGGAYLVFLFVKHAIHKALHKPEHAHVAAGQPFLVKFGLSPLNAIIIQIGVVDLAFAMDQVVAAVGFTKQVWLIVLAATIGLLSLRLLAPYLSRLMDWLPSLEDVAYVAVGFVGVLLVLEHPAPLLHMAEWFGAPASHFHYEMPKVLKVGVTLSLFLVPILIKLIFKVPKSKPGQHQMVEKAIEQATPIEAAADAIKSAAPDAKK